MILGERWEKRLEGYWESQYELFIQAGTTPELAKTGADLATGALMTPVIGSLSRGNAVASDLGVLEGKLNNASKGNVGGKVVEGSSNAVSIDGILKGATESTNGKGVARNFDKSGGFAQTLKDFDSLDLDFATVKEIQTQYGVGRVGKLKDGTTVVARPGSNTGGATLEIRVSNTKVYKVRY